MILPIYIMAPSTKILRILKPIDGPRMTSIIIVRDAHIVVEEVTQLINVIDYMIFHQTTKGENSLLTMSLQLKRQMRVRRLQIERSLNSLLVLVWPKNNITLSWILQQSQSQSQLAATLSTEHHNISNTSTSIICNLKSIPKFVLWILDSGVTDHISSSLENFVTYRIIPDIPIKLTNGTIVYANIKGTIIFSTTFILHNVQYTLRFNFNLISVSQLVKIWLFH